MLIILYKKEKEREEGEEKLKTKSKKKWGSHQQNNITNVEILKTNKKGKGGHIR
jgi:hypothetical protein